MKYLYIILTIASFITTDLMAGDTTIMGTKPKKTEASNTSDS